MKELDLEIGKRENLDSGVIVETRFIDKQLDIEAPTSTAFHEVEHGLLAQNKVKLISVIPGPGFNGITELDSYDEVAFAGPASQGRDGVGHDLGVIEYKGGNVEAAKMAARVMLSSIDDDVKTKVAGHLQAKGTLDGNQFRNAIDRFTNGEKVEITITSPDGIEETTTENGVKGEILIVSFFEESNETDNKDSTSNDNLIQFPNRNNHPGELDEAA